MYQYPQIDIKIQTAISGLEKTVDQRRREKELYQALIHETKDIKIYKFHDGAVPWRFNLFVSQDKKHKIIDILLKQKVPVSDWYPDVTPIFGNHRFYKNAKTMEKQIINFPLLIEDVEIQRICDCINQFANREKR